MNSTSSAQARSFRSSSECTAGTCQFSLGQGAWISSTKSWASCQMKFFKIILKLCLFPSLCSRSFRMEEPRKYCNASKWSCEFFNQTLWNLQFHSCARESIWRSRSTQRLINCSSMRVRSYCQRRRQFHRAHVESLVALKAWIIHLHRVMVVVEAYSVVDLLRTTQRIYSAPRMKSKESPRKSNN